MNVPHKRAPWLAAAVVLSWSCSATPLNVAIDRANTQAEVPVQAVPIRGAVLRGQAQSVAGQVVDFSGELLAVQEPSAGAPAQLVMGAPTREPTSMYAVPVDRILELRVVDHVNWPTGWEAGAAVVGAVASVPANGWWSVFSAPLWLIGGGALAIYHATSSDAAVMPNDLEQLRALARFPAGLPSAPTGTTAP